MKNETEIPCSNCVQWNQKAKTFGCNPNSCDKLSDWLMAHAHCGEADSVHVERAQVQYVV